MGRNEALKHIQRICREGSVVSTGHAKKELAKDLLDTVDAMNVLRGGRIFREPEFENGEYRYRVETPRVAVIVAFESKDELVLVTAWRKKR